MPSATLAADDHARACLIEPEWPDRRPHLPDPTWLGWAVTLPAAGSMQPMLASACLGAAQCGEIEAAETRLAAARQWLQRGAAATGARTAEVVASAAATGVLPATVAAARAFIAQARSDVTATIAHRAPSTCCPPMMTCTVALPGTRCSALPAVRRDLACQLALVEGMARLQTARRAALALRHLRLADIRLAQELAQPSTPTNGHPPGRTGGASTSRSAADLHLRGRTLSRKTTTGGGAPARWRAAKRWASRIKSPFWRYRLYLAQARWQQAHGDLASAARRQLDA
ncbi:MAG: hypothetical protein H6639_14890 [Caldilineaceae bacterium]|nr:hypothetical protein [Caldilineaceae bacterium]